MIPSQKTSNSVTPVWQVIATWYNKTTKAALYKQQPQPAIICSKLIIKTLVQDVKYVQS